MMPWSQWPTVAIRECYFARDLEVLVIESNFALLKIYPGKWWFTYPFSFFVFLKTGPEPECAPQCFFISKGISNIFNNNIEGRSNCKRDIIRDPGLTSPLIQIDFFNGQNVHYVFCLSWPETCRKTFLATRKRATPWKYYWYFIGMKIVT